MCVDLGFESPVIRKWASGPRDYLRRKYQFRDTCCLDSGSQRHLAFRQVVLTLLVVVWGLRLGMLLLMRILKWGEDPCFDEKRENMGKLVIFWTFQQRWKIRRLFQPADVIGWTMWVAGFLVEAIADQQKLLFKNSQENKGKWCNVGLWKYSRHPNYFGEANYLSTDRSRTHRNALLHLCLVGDGSFAFHLSSFPRSDSLVLDLV